MKSNMKTRTVLISLPLLVLTCAAMSPPLPAADAPEGAEGKATLLSSSGNGYFIYANEKCEAKKRVKDKWADILKGVPTATTVPAGSPIFIGKLFDTTGLTIGQKCLSTGSFTPIAGETYQLGLRFGENSCALVVLHKTGADTSEPEPTLILFKPLSDC